MTQNVNMPLCVDQQGPELNGYLVGRGNSREIDLNRNFPDLNALMYYYEKSNGRNHHLPLPENWENQVKSTEETQNITSLCIGIMKIMSLHTVYENMYNLLFFSEPGSDIC